MILIITTNPMIAIILTITNIVSIVLAIVGDNILIINSSNTMINEHFRNLNWRYLPYIRSYQVYVICKGYARGHKGIYHQNMALYGIPVYHILYLQFGNLKWPLTVLTTYFGNYEYWNIHLIW